MGIAAEFNATPYAYQALHFAASIDLARENLGFDLQTFGAPFNRHDCNTLSVIEATPENQAEIARRKGRAAQHYREAARLYEEIHDEAPTNFAALRGRGVALLRLGIVSQDSRSLETAATRHERDGRAA